jgi:hypothetical protein
VSTRYFPVLLAIFLCVIPPRLLADKVDISCRPFGGYDEDVCEISMIRLLADPQKFDGKIVRISGFFADGAAPLLFFDEGAYSSSRTVDSVLIKIHKDIYKNTIINSNRSFVIVIGRYSANVRTIPEGASAERISGAVDVIEASRSIGPWGYNEPPGSLMKADESGGGRNKGETRW